MWVCVPDTQHGERAVQPACRGGSGWVREVNFIPFIPSWNVSKAQTSSLVSQSVWFCFLVSRPPKLHSTHSSLLSPLWKASISRHGFHTPHRLVLTRILAVAVNTVPLSSPFGPPACWGKHYWRVTKKWEFASLDIDRGVAEWEKKKMQADEIMPLRGVRSQWHRFCRRSRNFSSLTDGKGKAFYRRKHSPSQNGLPQLFDVLPLPSNRWSIFASWKLNKILFKTFTFFPTGRNNNFKSALKLTFVQPSQT